MSMSRTALLALIMFALAGCGVLRDTETAGTEPRGKPDASRPASDLESGVLRDTETAGTEPRGKPGASRPASDLESLLLYFQYIKGLPGAELGKEHENARQAYARAQSEFNRVRLAMVLAQPNTPFNDGPRALELLEPVAKNQQAPLHGLAYLLAANIQDLQHKLDALKSLERSLSERDQSSVRKR
jgi:hypothetical protein